mgnify:CR=1 FL=1
MKKYIFALLYILLITSISTIGVLEYLTFNSLYHTLIIIGVVTININIWYQSTHTKNLHSALKRWLGWK